MIQNKAVKSRNRKKGSPQISLKKTTKKSPVVKVKNIKVEGLENTLLATKFKYSPNNSESNRRRSLGNAVVVYDPKGLHDLLHNLSIKNKNNKEISNIIQKDAELIKKEYFKFLK